MLSRVFVAALVALASAQQQNQPDQQNRGPKLPTQAKDLDNGNACQFYMCEYDCYRVINRVQISEERLWSNASLKFTNGVVVDAMQQGLIRQFDITLKPRSIYILPGPNNTVEDCKFGMQLAAARFNPSATNAKRDFALPWDLGYDEVLPQPTTILNNNADYRKNIFANLLVKSEKVPGCFNEEVPSMPRAAWPGDERLDSTPRFWMSNGAWATPSNKPTVTTFNADAADFPTLTPDGQVAHSEIAKASLPNLPVLSGVPDNAIPGQIGGGNRELEMGNPP